MRLSDFAIWRPRMLYLETAPKSGVYHRRGVAPPGAERFLALMRQRGLHGFVARDRGPTDGPYPRLIGG